jgi:D-lactate dehydrogenase (cytochrome)
MSASRSSFALDDAIHELSALLGARLATGNSIRDQHAHTLSWTAPQPPDAVAFARNADEVAAIVKICAAHAVPIIPFGTGTSLEGHVNAPQGGVCVDMSQMNAVLAVQAEDLTCVIQPGVTRKQLNDYLRDVGLFFPIDPGADASLGGMASTRASGTNAVRYGTMKDNVLALKVVLPNGESIKTGSRAKKSAAGYDLTRLFVGAEGTLGLLTELTLKLHPIPEAIAAGTCTFPTVRAACEAAIATIQCGLNVARIELLDELQVKACNLHSKLGLTESPLLCVEFHGSDSSVAEDSARFGEIAADLGGSPFAWATKPEDRSKLWQARHDVYWATLLLRPGAKSMATDVCVPISRLADCVEDTQRDIAATGLIAPIVGHVGDGNFHVGVLVDMNNQAEIQAVEAFVERLVIRALAMDGTCTGEHGVGQGKIKYLLREHGAGALNVMRQIKQSLDPQNIMNPGKILPEG